MGIPGFLRLRQLPWAGIKRHSEVWRGSLLDANRFASRLGWTDEWGTGHHHPITLFCFCLFVCLSGGVGGGGWVDTVPLCLMGVGQPCHLREGTESGCSCLVSPIPPSDACIETPCPVSSTAPWSAFAVVVISTQSFRFTLSKMSVILNT